MSGTGKATNFKFCTHILSIDGNKSPLQMCEKVAGCVVRTLKTFQGPDILGASRGLLCDSSAVLLTFLRHIFSHMHIHNTKHMTFTHIFVPFAQLKRLCKFFPLPWGATPPEPLSGYAYGHNSLHPFTFPSVLFPLSQSLFPYFPTCTLPIPYPIKSWQLNLWAL